MFNVACGDFVFFEQQCGMVWMARLQTCNAVCVDEGNLSKRAIVLTNKKSNIKYIGLLCVQYDYFPKTLEHL